jgi:hypothetical protein
MEDDGDDEVRVMRKSSGVGKGLVKSIWEGKRSSTK